MKKSMGGLANDDLDAISKRVKLKGDILATMTKNKPKPVQISKKKDYSAFRTPSGILGKIFLIPTNPHLSRSILLRCLQCIS